MIRLQLLSVAMAWWASAGAAHLPRRAPRAAAACEPVPPEGLFYLTGVPSDGSSTYPLAPAVVSRGAETLSSSTAYTAQFAYNTTDNRIYIGSTNVGSAEQLEGYPVLFGDTGVPDRAYGENGRISLATGDDCATYLVLTGSDTIYGWWSAPTNDDSLPKPISWGGEGDEEPNSAIRIGI